jgi:Tol biopolymer transport system component
MKMRFGLAAAMLVGLLVLSGCEWFWTPGVRTLGFAPLSGAPYTTVTVVGQGFGASPVDMAITFDGIEAEIVTWSDTNVVVRIPVLATPTGTRIATVRLLQGGVILGTGTFTVVRGVLFETNRDGNTEIYLMNPDGSQPTNLTNDPDGDYHPVWSPDGTKIAFVSSRDGNAEIYVMDADGDDPTNLTRHADSDRYPVWSPDGSKIAFTTDREGPGIVVVDTEPKIVPIVSNIEIFVMNADGSGQTNLTDDPGWDAYPAWSPDGSKILFQTDRDITPVVPNAVIPDSMGLEIYAIDADGSDPTCLSWSPEDDIYPTWSPDGSKILFQSARDGNWEIYTMNPDGSGQSRLTDHPDSDTHPAWSPDGTWITFHSDRDGNTEIYRMSAYGSSETRLTTTAEWDWGPSWSPDGSQIVFQSSRDGNVEIYRMNADGSSQTRLTHDPAYDIQPFWGTFGWIPPV